QGREQELQPDDLVVARKNVGRDKLADRSTFVRVRRLVGMGPQRNTTHCWQPPGLPAGSANSAELPAVQANRGSEWEIRPSLAPSSCNDPSRTARHTQCRSRPA